MMTQFFSAGVERDMDGIARNGQLGGGLVTIVVATRENSEITGVDAVRDGEITGVDVVSRKMENHRSGCCGRRREHRTR
jgi:hypothetical protein